MRCLDGITDSMDASLSKLGVSDGQGSFDKYVFPTPTEMLNIYS